MNWDDEDGEVSECESDEELIEDSEEEENSEEEQGFLDF